MRKLFTPLSAILLLFVFLFIGVNDAKASHAMGADITYRCLGPGPIPGTYQYEITFSFYRDCFGISAPPSMDIEIENTCGFPQQTVFINPLPSSPTQISPTCPSATTTCNGGTFTGIQEWIYQGIITLPGQCASWTFYHSESARNAAITTITGFGSDNLFVYSTMNNLNGLCDDSPVFSNKPVPFACVGQLFCFNHGAYDAQGDSLSYQIITPRTGPLASDTVTYRPGFSASQPVISTVRPMTFNTFNGDFCMFPTQADITVLAVLVNEYRNGVLIGQVERDIQVTVLACNNNLPSATGINGLPQFADSVCAGSTLCFLIRTIDPDTQNITTITWDNSIPGATFITTHGHRDSATFCWTPTAADINSSPYCFTVTVQDDNCPYIGLQVYSYCIKVNGVHADAGPDQSLACGVTANLNGNATGGNGTYIYIWNGDTSQVLNGAGVGTDTLIVVSQGCVDTDMVNLIPGLGVPAAAFSFNSTCDGTPAQFTDNSSVTGSTITSWLWDFGDGTTDNSQSPSHLYATNGTYNVTLTVTTPTNCTAVITQQITINTNIASAIFTSPNVCDGFPMNFTDQSTGGPFTSWSWNFNDPASGGSNTDASQNPTHTFTTPGNYTISLTVLNVDGCQNQIQQNVTVNANPTINVNDTSICDGSTAVLNGPGGFAIYAWDNGETTQSISVIPPITTNYTLNVTDVNGCVANHTATITVNPVPQPDAGVDQTICEGTNANLAGVTANGGTIFVWNPGNIIAQNIVVTPAATTDYTLTVSDITGCFATDMVTVNVNPMPLANADNDIGICNGDAITINSVTSNGVNILWTPGNFNTNSITVSPAVTTTYYLVVNDAIGCTGTDSTTVTVNPIPVASINNPNPHCGNNSVLLNDASTVASGSITGWFWDFGNGQTSLSQNPTVSYSSAGNYNISLIITTNGGCKDSATAVQTIWAVPVASFSHSNVCDGNPISFTDASSISDASPLNYNWDLGDNTTSNNTSFNHQYASYGAYPAKLVVTSSNGCADSIVEDVNVFPLPHADFKIDYACVDQPADFLNISTIPQGVVNSWYWQFGDNNSSLSENPTHNYATSGNYNIHFLVASDHGCPDSIDGVLRVAPSPVVDFTTQNACLGYSVNLTDFSTPFTGPIVQYLWNFGDGTTSSVQNPQHTYTSSGLFQVSLTATTDSGCSTTLTRPNALTIYALPHADFTSNASSADDIYPLVNFVNETPTSGFFYWNFGDGDTSTQFSPTHLYPDVGHYDVELLTIDHNGCIDSTIVRIEIKPTSNIYIPNAFTPNGDTRNDNFQVYSYNVKDMEVQIYDRWGIKIVEWKDPKGSWDGKINGNPAQADTYVYRVSTVDVNDKKEVYVGHVSLIR